MPSPPDSHPPARTDAPRSGLRTALSALAAALVIGAAVYAALVVDVPLPAAASPSPTATPAPIGALPTTDVAGEDIPGLPRPPGSVRIDFDREQQGSSLVTSVTYLAAASVDDLREGYRRIFRTNGWEVVELDVSDGEWVFLVQSEGRVALVEIEPRGGLASVQLEVESPGSPAAVPTPTPTPPPPAPPAPAPPPPGDDDDDDDGGDDD